MGVGMRALLLSAVALVVIGIGGCSAVDESTFGETEDVSPQRLTELNDELRGLPTLEVTLEDYRRLRERLTLRIREVAPETYWRSSAIEGDRYPDHRQSCSGEWADTDGRQVQLDRRVSAVPISEAHWSEALAVVRETVAEYGLKQIGAYRDLPDDRDIRFSGPGGSALMFGTFKAAVLSIQTPCRLPAGPPAPISPPNPVTSQARGN